jgi:FtsZ-interacting cell division protein ZipA
VDATAFRWVLVAIAVIVVLAIYVFGQHQARQRRRSAMETMTRDEVDSAFIEDEQLHVELDNLDRILNEDEQDEDFDDIAIHPDDDGPQTPYSSPDPEIFVPAMLSGRDPDRVVSYHLRHGDFRLITGEEASDLVEQAGLQLNGAGYLEFREAGEVAFRIASLSAPGTFTDIDRLDFTTIGFNCFVDLDACAHPRRAYEAMLKKIDELVRGLGVKVYKPEQELLTINDVTGIRDKLA